MQRACWESWEISRRLWVFFHSPVTPTAQMGSGTGGTWSLGRSHSFPAAWLPRKQLVSWDWGLGISQGPLDPPLPFPLGPSLPHPRPWKQPGWAVGWGETVMGFFSLNLGTSQGIGMVSGGDDPPMITTVGRGLCGEGDTAEFTRPLPSTSSPGFIPVLLTQKPP